MFFQRECWTIPTQNGKVFECKSDMSESVQESRALIFRSMPLKNSEKLISGFHTQRQVLNNLGPKKGSLTHLTLKAALLLINHTTN